MLQRLSIKNIALIRDQSIEFTNGLNVLTGETGAGKSLVMDSLSLLLGEKADKSLISYGESFARVEAVFTCLSDKVLEIMQDFGLEKEDTLVISRKISNDGKNECRVNGNVFTLSMLKKLSAPLMDLHGQFEHQNLLKVNNHIEILDSYGARQIAHLKTKYQEFFNQLAYVQKELSLLVSDDRERARFIDLYSYQLEEIDNAGFYEGEEEELRDFRNQVLHQEKIVETLQNTLNLGNGDGFEFEGILGFVKKMISQLSMISDYYAESKSYIERLEALKIELEDIVDSIEDKKDNFSFDEQKAKENEERLDLLFAFKKKYGSTISEILQYRESIARELEKLVNSKERASELVKKEEELKQVLSKIANELSQKRKQVAIDMQNDVSNELCGLGMKGARFVIQIDELTFENRNINGFDRVEFMLSANKGEAIKPLKAVASGGEMSRFMLAIKNITAKIEGISTLIFDEIDTGVSGKMALVLGEKLSLVSQICQVICVTHLPQVASFGDNHLFIEKYELNDKTLTRVKVLENQDRVSEIARLVSGVLTENSIKSGEELLENAKNFKKNLK